MRQPLFWLIKMKLRIISIDPQTKRGGSIAKGNMSKRDIKTAIAVFLSVLVSKLLHLEYPFFTAIAVIFSMENSIANSYRAGIYRLLGTLIGAFVGVIFVSIQPGNAVLMGMGTLALIFICNVFKWDRAVPIAGVVFASIMLSLSNKNPLHYSVSRILDTFVGIVIAVAVNYIIFPPNDLAQICKRIHAISERITAATVQFVCLGNNVDFKRLRKDVIDSIRDLETYKLEFKPKIGEGNEFAGISKELDSLRSILAHLKTVDELGPQCCLSPENAEKVRKLNLCDMKSSEYSHNDRNIIYNYHVGNILDSLSRLIPQISEE